MITALQRKEAARTALATRVQGGYSLAEPCDIYELICKHGLCLRFMNVSSLDGLYLNDRDAGAISISALRPSGHQHFTAAHELGHAVFGHGAKLDKKLEEIVSSSEEEELADAFARHLLMPKRAVLHGLTSLNVQPHTASATDYFAVASWLGVGYTSLLRQSRWTLGLIDNVKFHDLSLRPQQIKRNLVAAASWTGRRELWPLARWWAGSRVHIQVGDIVTGLQDPPTNLFVIEDGYAVASAAGQQEVLVGTDAIASISIARANYVGLYDYRYLAESLDG